jgi:hypothetical protein
MRIPRRVTPRALTRKLVAGVADVAGVRLAWTISASTSPRRWTAPVTYPLSRRALSRRNNTYARPRESNLQPGQREFDSASVCVVRAAAWGQASDRRCACSRLDRMVAFGHIADSARAIGYGRAISRKQSHGPRRPRTADRRDCESTAAMVSCLSMLEPRRPRAAFSNLGEFTVPARNCRRELRRKAAFRSAGSRTNSFRSSRRPYHAIRYGQPKHLWENEGASRLIRDQKPARRRPRSHFSRATC